MNSTIENSSHLVFSFYMNVVDMLKGKKVKDLFKLQYIGRFNKSSPYILNNCRRMYNDLENHLYTYADIFLYMSYKDLLEQKISIHDVTRDNIRTVSKLYTVKRMNIDMIKLRSIATKSNITSMREYFELDDCGDNILRNLVTEGHVSPITYIKKIKNSLTSPKEFSILCNEQIKTFHKKLNRIKKQVSFIKQRSA